MDLLADVRYALRLLRKTPIFTAAAIGILALGIGANATIFSLVQSVLVRPLPYANPDELVMVWEDASAAGFPRNTPAPGNYNDWRTLNRSFVDLAATRSVNSSLTMDGPPEQVLGRAVTANFFSVLGVQPQLGRSFVPAEDAQGVRVVIISHALWQRRYGADPAIVGRTVTMNDARHEIVGVAPQSFVFLDRDIDYWVPMQLPPEMASTRASHFLNVVARLRPGVSVQAADEDMKSIAAELARQYPDNGGVGAVVVPLREQVLGDTRMELVVLMIAAMSIVLIACANFASLLLSRSWTRRGEYAVRLSLGATRIRLARQIVVEALCLSIIGGVFGLVIPWLAGTMSERLVPVGLQLSAASMRGWQLFATAGVLSIATGALFSLGPALQSSRASTADALQQNARGSIGGGATRHLRDGLIVLQVAATLVLLVTAGLMLRTLVNLRGTELGFNPQQLLTIQVALPQPKYAEPARRAAFHDRVIAGVRAQPGVDGVAFGSTLPFQSIGNTRAFTIEGRPVSMNEIALGLVPFPDALFRVGTTDYMRTLGVVAAEGRLLDERDTSASPRAAVVNETLARQFLPNRSAIGHRIRFSPDEPWFTIVGVVRDVLERGYEQDAKPGVYVSAPQIGGTASYLVVRVNGDPLDYAAAVQQVIHGVDPDQPIRQVRPMSDVVNLTVADRQQHTTLLVVFGGLALLIASIGLYGLLSQLVSARSREIGLRIALGATWRTVVAMVMSRGIVLAGVGMALGTGIAWAATRTLQTLLYGVAAADPLTFAAVLGLLSAVTLAACAVPAVRAARVDPMVVLREQ
jgi:predicted permease